LRLSRVLGAAALVFVGLAIGAGHGKAAQAPRLSDKDIIDAYHYFLGRMLVLRQEHLDFKAGLIWNRILHREAGGVAWANPNLDVVYSEAWIAVDETSCTIVEVPAIKKRYYTVQLLNGWGETVANINERNFPGNAAGKFGLCLKGTRATLPAGTQRVELSGRKSRLLARVELGADPQEAVKLQRQIRVNPTGKPKIDPPVEITLFENEQLPRVEAFNKADAILASDRDINPGMEALQSKARAIAKAARDVEELKRIDDVIVKQAIPQFHKALIALGTTRNGWVRPATIGNYGSDFRTRSLINYAGIWANNTKEVVYFKTNSDGKGKQVDGSNVYTMTFPKGQPDGLVRYFWSVIAVDSVKFQVIDNPQKVYLLNNQTKFHRAKDGSLTLYFAAKLPDGVPPQNWLPTPAGQNYNLTFRFYGPRDNVAAGGYFPPPLVQKK
jgi:hypothetical protein